MDRESRPAPVIATSIRLHRESDSKAVIILEGSTDSRSYDDFIDKTKCRIIYSSSREKVIQILDDLKQTNFEGVLGIIDKESDCLDKLKWENSNLFYTDSHDLETMILASDAFIRFLNEFGMTNKKTKKDICGFTQNVRNYLVNATIYIGYLRWYSTPDKMNLQLSFKKLNLEKIFDKKNRNINFDSLINELKTISPECRVHDFSTIKMEILKHISGQSFDPWSVCSGHDMVKVLTILLKTGLGNERCNGASSDCIDGALRLSYTYSHFQQTILYSSIKKYEDTHKPYCFVK
jgi:hypothetical protein